MKKDPVLQHVVLWASPWAYRVPATAHGTVRRVWDTVPPNLTGYNNYCCYYFVINTASSAPTSHSLNYICTDKCFSNISNFHLFRYLQNCHNKFRSIYLTIFIVIDQNQSLIHAKCIIRWSDCRSHFSKHCCRIMVSPKFLNNVNLKPRNHV